MNEYYVYAWLYPCGTPFYVGKGKGRRILSAKAPSNLLFRRIVDKIRESGSEPKVVKWHSSLLENDAFLLEKAYIKLFGRRDNGTGILANLTDGGEGVSGYVASDDTREKLSNAQKKCWKIPGRRASQSSTTTDMWLNSEFRSKLSAKHRERLSRPEVKEKMSAAIRAACARPEVKMVRSAASREVNSRPVVLQIKREKSSLLRLMEPPRSGLYKGVVPAQKPNAWVARIKLNKKNVYLGTFLSQEEAAVAYDLAAVAAWGHGKCYLNFPVEVQSG